MRRIVSIAANAVLALSLACGETEGCGELGEYEYPRNEPEAQVTPEVARVRVTERGRPFVRSVCAVFDRYLDSGSARHSRAV